MSSRQQDPNEASEEHLPTMHEALKGLHDMEASLFHYMNYLIVQVATCTPFHEESTLAIFEPLHDAVVDFLNPVIEACDPVAEVISYFASLLERSPPASKSSWVAREYHSMRLNARLARRNLTLLDATIASIQAPLLDHLRGSCGLEPLLRALKWLGTPSTRVDTLDSLPQLLSEFRNYCQRTVQYLDIIEHFVVGLHDFFCDEGSVRALTGREDICRRLKDLGQFASKSIQYARRHPYMLGLKGSDVSVRTDHQGQYYRREDSIFSRGNIRKYRNLRI